MKGKFNRQEAANRFKNYRPGDREIPYRDELYITAPPGESHRYTFLVSLERIGRAAITPTEWRFRVPALDISEVLSVLHNLPSDAEVAGRELLRHHVQKIAEEQHVRVPLDDRTLLRD